MQYINADNVYLCETFLLKFEESFLELDTNAETYIHEMRLGLIRMKFDPYYFICMRENRAIIDDFFPSVSCIKVIFSKNNKNHLRGGSTLILS